MSGAAGAAGRGAGSERGAAGPWGRGWPARRGGKGKRSLPLVESPVHPVVFARAVSSTGYPLSTPHGITSVIKGEPNWSGSSTNRVCVACSRVWKFRLGQSDQPSTRAMSPPRDDCSSRPAVPVLTFRPAARPRWPRGRQLGTTHAQQRTGTASVSRSGASGGSVYAAARCASTARFVIRHLRPKRPVRGSSGFAAPARSGIRAARRNG